MDTLIGLFAVAVMAGPIVPLLLYIPFSVWVVRRAIRYARENGKSAKRWGWGTAFVMYSLVFWDWIPTVAVHQYYCAKDSGFWVYKTLDQWKAENPGGMEGLVYNKAMPYVQTPNGVETTLNQRFIHVRKYEGPFLFNRWRLETEIRDSKNGDVIAREIGFSTSQERGQAGWSGWKFWLHSERCSIESHRDQGSFGKITTQFEGAK